MPTDAQPGDIMTLTTQSGQRMKVPPQVERGGALPGCGPGVHRGGRPLCRMGRVPLVAFAGWVCQEGHLCDEAFHAAGGVVPEGRPYYLYRWSSLRVPSRATLSRSP